MSLIAIRRVCEPVVAAFLSIALGGACDRVSDGDGSSPAAISPGAGGSFAGTSAGMPAAGDGSAGARSPATATSGAPGSSAGAGAAGSNGIAGAFAAGASAVPMSPSNPPAMADGGQGNEPQAPDSGMGSPDAGSAPAPAIEDLGAGDGSDVITIGDSWMSLGTTGIQQSLVEISGQRYRTYGRGGTRLLNEAIPRQYTTAKMADPDIKTVVMTGGGNDIIQVAGLREDCAMNGQMCGMVLGNILDRLTSLWNEMAMDGVQDVVYVQYSNPEGNNVDFALPDGDGVKRRCEMVMAPLRCHRLETLDIVMGDIPDGIHPSSAAYDRIGKAVHELMVAEGMRR